MASTNKCTGFDTLDLAIVDQRVLALAKPGSVDFDTLYERAIASFDQTKITPLVSRST